MKTCLFSIAFAPSIMYFHYLNQNCISKIEAFENYQKQSFRNRCIILSSQGTLSLNIPVQHKNGKLIRDIRLSYSEKWQEQHWKTLKTCYNSSPFFEHYDYLLYPLFKKKEKYLFDYNLSIIEKLCDFLTITSPGLTSKWDSSPDNCMDYRNNLHPKTFLNNHLKEYSSVFPIEHSLKQHLSVLDLLFNQGPESIKYL